MMKPNDQLAGQNTLLEAGVLAGCLLCPWDFHRVMAALTEQDFADRANKEIYKAMLALHGRGLPPDTILLTVELRDTHKLSVVERVGALLQLGAIGPHLQFYVGELVVKSAARRKALELVQSSNVLGNEKTGVSEHVRGG